jgi:hypothetical protein
VRRPPGPHGIGVKVALCPDDTGRVPIQPWPMFGSRLPGTRFSWPIMMPRLRSGAIWRVSAAAALSEWGVFRPERASLIAPINEIATTRSCGLPPSGPTIHPNGIDCSRRHWQPAHGGNGRGPSPVPATR